MMSHSRKIQLGTLSFIFCLSLEPLRLSDALAESIPEFSDEIPEEVLEAEIILDARSPIDGSIMTPAEYAQLQDELRVSRDEVPGRLAPKLPRAVVLLRLRKILKTVFPFLF